MPLVDGKIVLTTAYEEQALRVKDGKWTPEKLDQLRLYRKQQTVANRLLFLNRLLPDKTLDKMLKMLEAE